MTLPPRAEHDVERAVAIQVSDREFAGAGPGVTLRAMKSPVPDPDQDRELLAPVVSGQQVKHAVPVDVGDSDRPRIPAGRVGPRSDEAASPAVQPDSY